ncbi:elongation factor Ts [Patescibacteria group bacterium]|nr:elongation factor Ts [Patescibacteria group bacterium]
MDLKDIKKLRIKSGVGIVECQKALIKSKGDFDKAFELLRKQGEKIIANRQAKSTNNGIIEAYIHLNGKIGVLIELACETDFVAKNKEFKDLAHDLAMQVAALSPQWINKEDVPEQVIKKEKEIYLEEIDKSKSKPIQAKIIDSKLESFYKESCLMGQAFIKNSQISINDLMQDKISKLGENIKVKKFTRFAI